MAEFNSYSDNVSSFVRVSDEPRIPFSLGTEEHGYYVKLLELVRSRGPDHDRKPRIVVITDVEQDYDDLLAIIFLTEMHRMGAIELAGCVANHYPALERAKFLRTVLDLFNLPQVLVAEGTPGANDVEAHAPDLFYGLKNKTFADAGSRAPFPKGSELINQLVDQSTGKPPKQKLTVLLISSLQDISEVFNNYLKSKKVDLQEKIHKCVSQGGYKWEDSVLWPEMGMVNNKFDRAAAKKYTETVQGLDIPSDAWSREAAKASALDGQFFKKLFGLGPIGAHLKWMWLRQEFKFYWDSQYDPFMPHLNFGWYLNTRLGLAKASDAYKTWVKETPRFEQVLPCIKVIPYDCCAAVGAVGDDFMHAMGVLTSTQDLPDYNKTKHRMFGCSVDDLGGISPTQLARVMEVFLHGALLATHTNGERMIHSNSVEHYTKLFTDKMGRIWEADSHEPLFKEIKESWKELRKCKDKALDARDSRDLANIQFKSMKTWESLKKVKEAEEAEKEATRKLEKAQSELQKVQDKVREDQASPPESRRLRENYNPMHQQSFTAPYEWLYQQAVGSGGTT